MALLFHYMIQDKLHYNLSAHIKLITATLYILTSIQLSKSLITQELLRKIFVYSIFNVLSLGQGIPCTIQTLKRENHFQSSPMTTNPTNIKLETPVSFC